MVVLSTLLGLAALVHTVPESGAPLVIDGAPDEALWKEAIAAPLRPRGFGAPFPGGGEARFIVRGEYLCVSAKIPEPARVVAVSVGKNPDFLPEDLIIWRFHVFTGGRNKLLVFSMNPFGGYRMDGGPLNRALAAARVSANEWSVEAAIPLRDFSKLAMASVERVRALRPDVPELHYHWPEPNVYAEMKLPDARAQVGAPRLEPVHIGNAEPPIEVRRVASANALNDSWTDAAWQASPAWELRRDEANPRASRYPAKVRLAHDGRNLALLARMEGAEAADEFQLYLSASGAAFAQFLLSSNGSFRDARGNGPTAREPDAEAWDSGATARVSKDGDAWIARMDIPIDSLARAFDAEGPQWQVLMRRVRRGEVTTLPVMLTSMPRAAARYRRLRLAENASMPPEIAGSPIPHQVWAEPDRMMVEKQLRARMLEAARDERKQWEQVKTRADWEKFRDKRLNALRASLGPFPQKTPLRVRTVKKVDFGEGFVVENLAFESRPNLLVTANLYLPQRHSGKIPAIVLVQNHQGNRVQVDLQDMGMSWARAGVAVLVMDMLGAGERVQSQPWPREGSYYSRYTLASQLYLAGDSLMKWMVWDLMRGIDVLAERPYVDASRILMIGSVAGGGDPTAVAAALDDRIAAVVPFNFGEAGPEEHYLGIPRGYENETAFTGFGSWESTRNLRRSVADQFLPWFLCASVAPRRFLYSFELEWPKGVEKQPPWPRYQKVYSFYGKPENLDHVDGFGPFPGPGEGNIPAFQRRRMHPILARWLNVPTPAEEWHSPRTLAELSAFTPELVAERKPKTASELARGLAMERLTAARTRGGIREALRAKLGEIEPHANANVTTEWTKEVSGARVEAMSIETDRGVRIPLLLLKPPTVAKPAVVLGVAQGGKERFLQNRWPEIEALLRAGVAVCLPDLRAIGETARDAAVRGPNAMGWAASELMLGNTLIGAQLKDIRTLLTHLTGRTDVDGKRIVAWGDSFAPVNPRTMLVDESLNMPAGPQIQYQAEPAGPLLAMLAALYDGRVRAAATRRGLVSFLSVLDDRFAYVPQDAIVPGMLEAGDMSDIEKALSCPLLKLESVDGRNRLVGALARENEAANWILDQLKRM